MGSAITVVTISSTPFKNFLTQHAEGKLFTIFFADACIYKGMGQVYQLFVDLCGPPNILEASQAPAASVRHINGMYVYVQVPGQSLLN